MKAHLFLVVLLISIGIASIAAATEEATLRVRFGMKDADPTDWSGGVKLSEGKVVEISGWRWTLGDKATGDNWTVHTRAQPAQGQPEVPADGKRAPLGDNGVVLKLTGTTPATQVQINAGAVKAAFKLADLPYGKRLVEMKGNFEVERTPSVEPLVMTEADEDYPAAAVAPDGTIYVAWLAFTRGKDFGGHRERVATPEVKPNTTVLSVGPLKTISKPEDLDYLAEPTGGEKIFVRAYRDGKWGEPFAVTDGKTEYYRPAIAVDGTGRLWVFYPAHLNADATLDHGNWDLMARAITADGKVGEEVNVSHAPGPDFMPSAATDSQGNVWVSWMGGREAGYHIYLAHQQGDGFSEAQRISNFTGNEWDPVVAADKKGHVAVAWDTYEKGDYDVYVSTRSLGGEFAAPQPVAATLNFEVRPSITYDNHERLWIAWEQSGETWGKDFGALKKMGIPLYQGRSLGTKVLQPDGTWSNGGDPSTAIPAAGRGGKNVAPRLAIAPTFPRLACDDRGVVWMSFRGRPQGPAFRTAVGSIWCEYVTYFDGKEWAQASWVPHSNGILDNRPAMVATPNHDVLMAFCGDGRGDVIPNTTIPDPNRPNPDPAKDAAGGVEPAKEAGVVGATKEVNPGRAARGRRGAAGGPDPKMMVYMTRLSTDGAADVGNLESIPAEKVAVVPPPVEAERQAIASMRQYRADLNGQKLRIWRGEFHRHTELSPDGGGDGSLLDMWRYVNDAVSLDWIGDGDHDYGQGREYSWWTTQKTVTLFTLDNHFVPMFSYERSVVYPEGHRNCVFAKRGIRSLPRLPLSNENNFAPAPDTNLLYMYLHHFDGVCAPHTSATGMGTDWRNNDPAVEPFVEIYQGDRNNYERPDAPRSAVREAAEKGSTPEKESFGGYKPKGFVNLALLKGYRLAFESSSDHISTHLSFCNCFVTEPTREAILDAMKKRRVYAATANIIADVQCKDSEGKSHFMGEEFSTASAPSLSVHLVGAKELAEVVIIKDDVVVHTIKPNQKEVNFSWTDPNPSPGKTSYYYVRGEQTPDMAGVTGELVWASPMWIKVKVE